MFDIQPFEISRIEEVEVGTKVYFYTQGKGGYMVRSMTFWANNDELDFVPREGAILPKEHQDTPGYWDRQPVPEYMRGIA